jgi:hypothetical protein
MVPRGGLRKFNQFNDLAKSGTHTIIMLSNASVPPPTDLPPSIDGAPEDAQRCSIV